MVHAAVILATRQLDPRHGDDIYLTLLPVALRDFVQQSQKAPDDPFSVGIGGIGAYPMKTWPSDFSVLQILSNPLMRDLVVPAIWLCQAHTRFAI